MTAKSYDWVTDEMFDKKLLQIMRRSPHEIILAIPGIYEALSEHYNNEVLEELEEERASTPVTVFEVTSEGGKGTTCVMEIKPLRDMFDTKLLGMSHLPPDRSWVIYAKDEPGSDGCEPYLIKMVSMTQAEVDNPPEFEGW